MSQSGWARGRARRTAALAWACLALSAPAWAAGQGFEGPLPGGAPAVLPGPVVPLLDQDAGWGRPPRHLPARGDEDAPPGPGFAGAPGRMPPPFMMAAPMGPPIGLDVLLTAPQSGARVLDVAEASRRLDQALAQGNPELKLGPVTEKNEDTLIAEIVTAKGGGLVRRLAIDRHTWLMRVAD